MRAGTRAIATRRGWRAWTRTSTARAGRRRSAAPHRPRDDSARIRAPERPGVRAHNCELWGLTPELKTHETRTRRAIRARFSPGWRGPRALRDGFIATLR